MQNECRGNNCRTDTVKHDLMEIIMFWDETQKHCADREDWRRCVVQCLRHGMNHHQVPRRQIKHKRTC